MNIILFDDQYAANLLPFTFTRPVCELRLGILTIREKWERFYVNDKASFSYLTKNYLQDKFACQSTNDNYYVNGALLPTEELVKAISGLEIGKGLMAGNKIIALRSDNFSLSDYSSIEFSAYDNHADFINFPWEIFSKNDQEIKADFKLLTANKKSQVVSSTNQIIGSENIFIEEGAKVECSIINASTGPVYIGKNAEVMEGCIIRGPFALNEGAVLKMGAKIYGATTIGPGCKVGGEVSNSVFIANSNKAHDGFLGNSVVGEWCNLGADTNTSNLKNNYSNVKVWSYHERKMIDTGLLFCGLMMGDHSKCGINTMFNTGTVVGVSANIFGAGFPDKFLPSFTWGGTAESEKFLLDKAVALAATVMKRRGISMTPADEKILSEVFLNELNPISE
ncbi:MAG: GlmU family protein [Bacteroidota bacterium]|jgi:UDP-N-acetylglucosamine diphosphorylase/glucosamine-1-phosphate N-acetyltransferase